MLFSLQFVLSGCKFSCFHTKSSDGFGEITLDLSYKWYTAGSTLLRGCTVEPGKKMQLRLNVEIAVEILERTVLAL